MGNMWSLVRRPLPILAFFVFVVVVIYTIEKPGAHNLTNVGWREDRYYAESRYNGSVDNSVRDITNSTFGFEDILVINLPRRTDRRDAMTLAAAYSNMQYTWIKALPGSEVAEITLPLEPHQVRPTEGSRGSWRAHLNAIQQTIERNLTTSLIMEDDLDWDLRIREQLQRFALAVRALTQPLVGRREDMPIYADPSFPDPTTDHGNFTEIPFDSALRTVFPRNSPYGDNWDVLWLGHCGTVIPIADTRTHPRARIVQSDDETVPSRHKIAHEFGPATLLKYPEHTRLTHHGNDQVCSLAYAVSQRGARAILYEMSTRNYTGKFDLMLRDLCDGNPDREVRLTCLTTQPSLFTHWRPRGSRLRESDIEGMENQWRDQGSSFNIRQSVNVNMGKLVRGEKGNWVDQYPDERHKVEGGTVNGASGSPGIVGPAVQGKRPPPS